MPKTELPPWCSVPAVVAHPDDESFALGAVLAAFAEAGAQVSVLCLTRGEASTLHGVAGDLTELGADELTAAAAALGLHNVELLAYPDGRLPEVDLDQLATHVVTTAAIRAAETLDLPVLGWTVPDAVAQQLRDEHGAPFDGHAETDIDLVLVAPESTESIEP